MGQSIATRKFTLLPEEERSARVRPLSCRLYVGKLAEHREAAEFIATAASAHGEGVDTIVRALLLYRSYLELQQRQEAGEPIDEDGQLVLLAGAQAGARQPGSSNGAAATSRKGAGAKPRRRRSASR